MPEGRSVGNYSLIGNFGCNYVISLDLLQNGFDNRRLAFQAHITESWD